ncbi:Spore Coat Protein U domain-containing protein [Pseudomonas poae]|uniref:Spore Coat Protein U domain-containing protein n=3 Tax=Pseudomonas poae TaxID=200451 RepID=A0ABY0S7E2_9PSED|nr:Spore Coat Protein U domain-containing protein [Pseudomonas poae]
MKGRAVLAIMGAMLCDAVYAAQLQVVVRIDVQRGCQLVGTTRSAGVEQLSVLDFGSGPRLDDPAGPLSAALISQRQPRLECNPDTPYQMRVDGGLHGGTGEVRYLGNATASSKPIPYRIYADAARLIPLPVNVPVSGRVPDSGSVDLPLYGRIDPLKDIPAVGRYTDLLKVTVTW